MASLEKSVLATIIYYDIFDFPLSLLEVFRYLINPSRVSGQLEPGPGTLSLDEVRKSLNELVSRGLVETREGFYFPSRLNLDGRMLVQERIEKNKIAEEKWKKAKKYVFWLQVLPFVEIIFASGSLALGHTSYDSDLDVLVVAQKGRIWLARFLLILATSFLGVRRTKYEKVAPDKICLNHFVSGNSLSIPFESLYNAQTYVHVTPLYYKNQSLVAEFYEQNKWVKEFLPNCDWPSFFQYRAVKTPRPFYAIKTCLEFVLNRSGLGKMLEKIAKKIQKSRINADLPGRITISDEQLEFHPYSVEKNIVSEFNRRIYSFGFFGGYKELDSGLK